MHRKLSQSSLSDFKTVVNKDSLRSSDEKRKRIYEWLMKMESSDNSVDADSYQSFQHNQQSASTVDAEEKEKNDSITQSSDDSTKEKKHLEESIISGSSSSDEAHSPLSKRRRLDIRHSQTPLVSHENTNAPSVSLQNTQKSSIPLLSSPSALTETDERLLDQLCSAGFDRDLVIAELRQCSTVDEAVTRLLHTANEKDGSIGIKYEIHAYLQLPCIPLFLL